MWTSKAHGPGVVERERALDIVEQGRHGVMAPARPVTRAAERLYGQRCTGRTVEIGSSTGSDGQGDLSEAYCGGRAGRVVEPIGKSRERRFWFFWTCGTGDWRLENGIWQACQRWPWGAWAERQGSDPGVVESLRALCPPRPPIGRLRATALRVDDELGLLGNAREMLEGDARGKCNTAQPRSAISTACQEQKAHRGREYGGQDRGQATKSRLGIPIRRRRQQQQQRAFPTESDDTG